MADIQYLSILFFLVCLVVLAFLGFFRELSKFSSIGLVLSFGISVTILMLRDPLASSDAEAYLEMFESQKDLSEVLSAYHGNVVFSFFQFLFNISGVSSINFLIFSSLLYYVITYFSFGMIFKSRQMHLTSISLFAISSTFILLFTNVLRQGLALSLLFLALGFFIRNNKLFGFAAVIASVFSHFSALPLLVACFISDKVNLKNKNWIWLILLMLPASFFLGHLLQSLVSLGGLFIKLEALSSPNYYDYILFVRLGILYISLWLFYFYGINLALFENYGFKIIFIVYTIFVSVTFITLSTPLISSRFSYYCFGIFPILYTYILYSNKNFIDFKTRAFLGIITALATGFFVYSFPSTRGQLGF